MVANDHTVQVGSKSGTSGRRCSRSPLGGRLATTIVDRYFHHYFLFFLSILFSVATFSHRGSARIKKLIQQKLLEIANILGLHPFPDLVGHFGASGDHFGFVGL